MKKIGKGIQKLLSIIAVLLIIGTIGIFVYPVIEDKTELDDKAVSFLAKQADKLEWETEEATEGMDSLEAEMSKVDEEMDDSENTEGEDGSPVQLIENEQEDPTIEEVVANTAGTASSGDTEVKKDDSRAQTWSQEEKEALKKVYGTILNWMGLEEKNLLFYEMEELNGTEYYAFQVVDDFGDAYERLMYFDDATDSMYWHEKTGNLVSASSADCIYSGVVEGKKEVDYEDSSWDAVLDRYMKTMFELQDREKADTFVDNTCYYLARLSENNRKRFLNSTPEIQEKIISLSESLEEQKSKKTIDDYSWKYQVLDKETYIDEFDMDWIDVYIAFDVDVTQHGEKDLMGGYYCVRLREYEYGWRVASMSEDY